MPRNKKTTSVNDQINLITRNMEKHYGLKARRPEMTADGEYKRARIVLCTKTGVDVVDVEFYWTPTDGWNCGRNTHVDHIIIVNKLLNGNS